MSIIDEWKLCMLFTLQDLFSFSSFICDVKMYYNWKKEATKNNNKILEQPTYKILFALSFQFCLCIGMCWESVRECESKIEIERRKCTGEEKRTKKKRERWRNYSCLTLRRFSHTQLNYRIDVKAERKNQKKNEKKKTISLLFFFSSSNDNHDVVFVSVFVITEQNFYILKKKEKKEKVSHFIFSFSWFLLTTTDVLVCRVFIALVWGSWKNNSNKI